MGIDREVASGIIDEECARFGTPGVAVSLLLRGTVELSEGFGHRDVARGIPMTARTLLPIASATKAFTAAVAGSLVQEGRLEWDRPVREYLPELRLVDPVANENLSIRDMLSHRSGLPRHDFVWYGEGSLSPADIVRGIAHLDPSRGFREAWQYNNLMYIAVGRLIEVLLGCTWQEAVRHRLLEPLGMRDTNFSAAGLLAADDRSEAHFQSRRGEVAAVPFSRVESAGPAGGINSCADDMGRWLEFHLTRGRLGDRRVLDEAILAELHTQAMVLPAGSDLWEGVEGVGYGLGWFLQYYRGHRIVWHTGNADGFSSFVAFAPVAQVGVSVLSNMHEDGLPQALGYRLLDHALEIDPVPWGERLLSLRRTTREGADAIRAHRAATTRKAPPTHDLADYAGDYIHPAYGQFSISLEAEGLVPRFHGVPLTFTHRHFDVWEVRYDKLDMTWTVCFVVDDRGDVAELTARFEPTIDPIRFTRVPDEALSRPERLAPLVGTYATGALRLTISMSDGVLSAEASGVGRFELVPHRERIFRVKGRPELTVEFVLEGEDVVRVVVEPLAVFDRANDTSAT